MVMAERLNATDRCWGEVLFTGGLSVWMQRNDLEIPDDILVARTISNISDDEDLGSVAVILMTQIMCQSVILSDYDIILSSNKSGPAALYILSFSTSICLYFVITWYIRLCNLPRS